MGPLRSAGGIPRLAGICLDAWLRCNAGKAGRRFLAIRAESDAGHSQTKMRICVIDAAGQLAGVPSPSTDPTIGAFRHGIRRVKHAARGPVRPMFRSEIPAAEMPPETAPGVPAAERLSRRGLSATELASARAAAGRHLMLLSDATALRL